MSLLHRHPRPTERHAAERVTLVISALLLVTLLATVAWLELSRGSQPAKFDVTPHFAQAYRHGDDWYLPVTVENVGDRPTDTVRIDLVRPVEGGDPEVAELEFVFVAADEQVEATATFDERPTKGTIEIDVQSSTEP